jgi:hypothetical protein
MKHHKVLWLVLVVIGIGLWFSGCQNVDHDDGNMDFEYPLTVGNSWEYDKIYTLNFDAEANSNGYNDTTYYYNGNVEIVNYEVIFDTLEVFNFETNLYEDGSLYHGNEYYNVEDSCLIQFAYTMLYMLKDYEDIRQIYDLLQTGVMSVNYAQRDTIYYDPAIVFDYPLEMDKQWSYRSSGSSILIDKTIIASKVISVMAGNFNCWEIRWTYPESSWIDDINFLDYVSEEGLIKRYIEYNNMECVDEYGNIVGYLDSVMEYILIDFVLVE